MTVRRSRFGSFLWRWLVRIVVAWLLLTVVPIFAMRWLNPPTSAFMIRDRVQMWLGGDSHPLRQRWVPFRQISSYVKRAVIASEDQKFPDHFGFDFDSIANAFDEREKGERVRGASTITQQVAKNLFLWPGQNWIRKGIEAYLTVIIEICWSKQRTLEIYLNIAEFGRGVYGVGAASDGLLHKSPSSLSAADGALLAAVLPNPQRFRVVAPSAYVRRRQAWILRQMQHLGTPAILRVSFP